MPKQYPVMLYRNSFDDWAIADDDEQKAELLNDGYMTHADFVKKDDNDNGSLDVSEMTKKDIMQGLDDLEIEYNNRDSKDTLAEILTDALSE